MTTGLHRERGQASIELVAVLPFMLLLGAVVWQFALAGHAAWLAANAARAGARAEAVGSDPSAAARSSLPGSLEKGLEVDRLPAGGVRVSVRVPIMVRAWSMPVPVSAVSSLGGHR